MAVDGFRLHGRILRAAASTRQLAGFFLLAGCLEGRLKPANRRLDHVRPGCNQCFGCLHTHIRPGQVDRTQAMAIRFLTITDGLLGGRSGCDGR